ncbi:MAG: CotH kinase family protein [Bacteroidia bacterium]|nr:CotH kinase family protein [Bacteroidia bacterium]
MRKLFIFIFLFTITSINAQVVINEYSCSNISIVADNYGNYEDWIEIYNQGTSAVSLAGYYLSDKPSNPTKWVFPAGVSISANSYLKVWCSGRNEFLSGNIHTNFKLTQTMPESIVFSNPSVTILENILLNPAQKNHSRGRTTDGASTWSVFLNPTPGTTNSGASQNYATTPSFSQQSGFFTGSTIVSITSPDPGVTIRYTTNGNEPVASSTVYSTPVTISSTMVIRAKAFSSNPLIPASFTSNNTYFINENHNIAVISVFGDNVDILFNGSNIEADAGLEYFDKTNIFRAEATGITNKHGNDSWYYDQRGIDFVTRDQHGQSYALLWKLFNLKPRTKFQRIILKAAANDNYPFESGSAHIRDPYVQTLSQLGDLHMDERTYEPCVVFMNGQYWGLYDMREKVDDADFTDYYYNSDENDVQMLKTWGGTWSEYGGTQAQTDWNSLKNFILSNNMAIQANYDYVDNLYNTKSLVDYFVLNSYVVCSDWLNWNTEWWRGTNANATHKKWRYALWDEDATFGHYINYTGIPDQNPTADPCNPEQFGDPGNQGHVPILNALLANPTFKQYYVARFADLSNTAFKCDRMIFVLDSLIALFSPEMPQQIARWGGTITEWQQNVQTLKNFINARCTQIQQGMLDCYTLTGPYPITFDVFPPNSGTVKVNSVWAPTYPWTAYYYGNMQTLLKAQANSGWMFDYWESVDPVLPGINNDTAYTTITQTQTIIAHFIITEPLLVGSVTVTNPTCYGNNNGVIDITVSGGTTASGNYSYIWSNGNTTQDISNLSSGTYYVTVNDDDTCSLVLTAVITGPSAILLTTSQDTSICNGSAVSLFADASGGTPPYTWYWNGVVSDSVINVSPSVSTNYTVSITDANGCNGPIKTIQIQVSQPVIISISLSSDSICPGDSVSVNAVVSSGNGGPYIVYNVSGDTIITPYFIKPPQTQTVLLYAKDGCGSVASDTDTIHVLTMPVVNFTSDFIEGCNPLKVTFNNNTNPQSQGQTYEWNFGDNDNNFSTTFNPSHVYNTVGDFDVSLKVITTENCNVEYTIANMISVYPKPVALFQAEPKFATIVDPIISFINQSNYADYYNWTFGDSYSSTETNPYHKYNAIRTYNVQLIAVGQTGCRDTINDYVTIEDQPAFYAPTAFTPDRDNINSNFMVFGNGIDINNFHLYIYNRLGEKIFETDNPLKPWDGKYKGKLSKSDTYTWLAIYMDIQGKNMRKPEQ